MLFQGKNSEMVLFKDKEDINHRNMGTYTKNIRQLAELLKQSGPKALLDASVCESSGVHEPDHNGCAGLPDGGHGKLTEKRMCRCMNYYDATKDICQNCALESKWHNVGGYAVKDYEVPMLKVISKVGGIDLILEGPDGSWYTVEVKPQDGNDDSLVRMIAEALTYFEAGGSERRPGAKPAICFFHKNELGKLTPQAKDFLNAEIAEDPDFKYLLSKVAVFYITIEKRAGNVVDYTIHNNAEEPLQ